jgi:hypothetical protein
LSLESKAAISEQYQNSANFTDGEIYLKIRHYQSKADSFAEGRWWSYLSLRKQQDLSSFLKNTILASALETLRVIPGVFGGLKITTLQYWTASKCFEVS